MAALTAELSDLKPVSRVLHGLRLPRLSIIRLLLCV